MSHHDLLHRLKPEDRPKGRDKTPRIKAVELAKYLSEEAIQIQVAQYLDHNLPEGWRWHHPPNGGWRKKSTAARLKAMGVKPGVPDVVILRPNATPIWIELKAFAGVLSPAQKAFRDWCVASGHPYFVARSVGDVVVILKEFRERRLAA